MTTPAALAEAARQSLGTCEITAVLGSAVARVRDNSGQEFVVKRHGSREKYDREVHAYRRWTPVLGSSAPALTTADPVTLTILTTALPGEPPLGGSSAAVHQQAGTLLRRFHEAEPPRDLPWFSRWLGNRARHWATQAAALLTDQDTATIGRHLAALAGIGIPRGGPCHLDFQPRNWLVDDSGNVALIDFEHARIDIPARDFVRLRFRTWVSRPDLEEAFFTGYGRRLTCAEEELIWHLGALDTLTALARGYQTGDAALIAAGRATLSRLGQRHR
jgi:hypothetical protein